MPEFAGTAIAAALEQIIFYDFSHMRPLLQRNDRYKTVGGYWTFYTRGLDLIDATIVRRRNTQLFNPPKATGRFFDGTFEHQRLARIIEADKTVYSCVRNRPYPRQSLAISGSAAVFSFVGFP